MSLTKPLNSKVNMKQYSNADLPVNPKQPAVARYAAESTASQTVINLPFQVDTVNAADSFMLMVDGKVLTPGATNDYQFSGVDSFGFSSSVTLNYSLTGGLNIQAIKLGLKKETEFVQDARFTALYEGIDQGLQGFVRTADLMLATTATGTPAAGLFHSTIQNRAAIPDLRTDLKARMGIERIPAQQIYQIQNEFGPNGEAVWGVVNDDIGQIRLVGNWLNANTNNGTRPQTSSGATTDFIEISFYGTGLNLCVTSNLSSRTHVYSVDGGSESSNFYPTLANPIANRNYTSNTVVTVVSGLSLGVHTVKIRNTNASQNMDFSGFEVINEAASVSVNPGASYLAGKKATTIAQASLAYNSDFESGTLGTRGGRVLVYQKADGSIAKAVQPVDAAQANLTSADHQNEEIARIYSPREFGAGRSDDFSTLTTSRAAAFTLDDGTTSLLGDAVLLGQPGSYIAEGLYPNAAANFVTITFVGTGLDITLYGTSGVAASYAAVVDGTSIGTLATVTESSKVVKVVSGLPYGSHTVKLSRSGAGSVSIISNFIVYQPKKPTLPAGAFEIADYNVVADFSASGVSGTALTDNSDMYAGVIAKAPTRELTFVGTFSSPTIQTTYNLPGGFHFFTTTNNDYIEYSFFGTGLCLHFTDSASGTNTFDLRIDGVLTAGATDRISINDNGSGSYTISTAVGGQPARLSIKNLSLGLHKVRVTRTGGGAAGTALVGMYIITPIHSIKSDLYADLQNTLPVGSCSISDNRQTTSVKDSLPVEKSWAQAIGISSGPTSTSTAAVPVPDLSLTVKTTGGALDIAAFVTLRNNTLSSSNTLSIYVDGVLAAPESTIDIPVANNNNAHNICAIVPVSPGTHKVDIYHRTSGGTTTFAGTGRLLKVREL